MTTDALKACPIVASMNKFGIGRLPSIAQECQQCPNRAETPADRAVKRIAEIFDNCLYHRDTVLAIREVLREMEMKTTKETN